MQTIIFPSQDPVPVYDALHSVRSAQSGAMEQSSWQTAEPWQEITQRNATGCLGYKQADKSQRSYLNAAEEQRHDVGVHVHGCVQGAPHAPHVDCPHHTLLRQVVSVSLNMQGWFK